VAAKAARVAKAAAAAEAAKNAKDGGGSKRKATGGFGEFYNRSIHQ